MLKITDANFAYYGAELDSTGNPVKVSADRLAIVHYIYDQATSSGPTLTVTVGRFDDKGRQFGPISQYTIKGDELSVLLAKGPVVGDLHMDYLEDALLSRVPAVRAGLPNHFNDVVNSLKGK